ncbi:MAG TPA: rhodanese-like domain-containing protein [Cyclobacteriaceae bacterium]|nr:rhodanese-like domain-containing protein [Cyclobacteriaceae bacterium]
MKIEQIYTGCLAHGAYYIESNGEVAIVDPLREVNPYLEKAKRNNAKIKYVLETHFHADFVSGHLDLAKETGATIVFGPSAKPAFKAHVASDGEILKLGNVALKVLHTPGHTMESACYLLLDEKGKETALFSGDTLFIGDVGRPDLAQKSDLTLNDLAGHLYDSLRNKIIPLNDDVIVYPAHGAGSACGKKMSQETSDTLGHQKKTNYALRAISKDQFIKEVTEGLTKPPVYFPQNVRLNREGYSSFEKVLKQGTQALSVNAFEAAANETDALIIDTRNAQIFAKEFIPGSINIGISGTFAPWVGTLIPDVNQSLLIVAEPGKEEEVITRLARVGYDNAIGYLKGGLEAWKKAGKETDGILAIDVNQLVEALKEPNSVLLDSRKASEYQTEHFENAENLPLDYINETFHQLSKDKTYYVHCAGGYRSMIFVSILRARGYRNLVDVQGGFGVLKASGKFKITDYVQPITEL